MPIPIPNNLFKMHFKMFKTTDKARKLYETQGNQQEWLNSLVPRKFSKCTENYFKPTSKIRSSKVRVEHDLFKQPKPRKPSWQEPNFEGIQPIEMSE